MVAQRVCPKCRQAYPISVNFCKKDKLLLDESTIQQVATSESTTEQAHAERRGLVHQSPEMKHENGTISAGRTERAKPTSLTLEILRNGKLIKVDSNTVLGREFQTEFENENTVSRRHCIIFSDASGRLCVQDNNSTNGTVVNNELLVADKAHALKKGDTLRLGDVVCRVVALS